VVERLLKSRAGVVGLLALFSCERTVELDLPAGAPQLVVEGYLEAGLPPLVLLTRSQPVFAPFDAAAVAAAHIGGAHITVSTAGDTSVVLREVLADTLPPPLRQALAQQTGLRLDPATGRFAVPLRFYTALSGAGLPTLVGRPGRTYGLRVEAESQVATAVTSVPPPVPLDSLFFRPPTDARFADSLVQLFYRFRDPDTLGNATRYFTRLPAPAAKRLHRRFRERAYGDFRPRPWPRPRRYDHWAARHAHSARRHRDRALGDDGPAELPLLALLRKRAQHQRLAAGRPRHAQHQYSRRPGRVVRVW
jgi:hypothetical protein